LFKNAGVLPLSSLIEFCARWPPPPRPSFENILWINVDLPVATAPYTIQFVKFTLVKTFNQIRYGFTANSYRK
jgi:hypothetical protein